MKKVLILSLLIISSCAKKSTVDLKNLNGYWEIFQVEKEGAIVKEYTISTTVDYFKLDEDTSGFRKKVAPQLDGSFVVSKVASTFNVTEVNDEFHIVYTNKNFNTDEIIRELTKVLLTIENSEGFTYRYKRFEKLNLIDE